MRHLVCFNFLPKRRISCPKGPRSHGFCGLTEAQAALNYVARSCLKSEGQQSFIPLAPHSWLRHIDSACLCQGFQTYPLLRGTGDEDVCKDYRSDSRGVIEDQRGCAGSGQDHCEAHLPPTLPSKQWAGSVALSAWSPRAGALEDLASTIWGGV